MPKLSILLESSKTTHELTDDRITIGRAPDNMIQIDDPSVSGRHAQLLLIDERYQLKDLGSTNGTRVNSELVTDVFLRVGDRIRFGKVEARYESDATGEAQPLPDAGEIDGAPGGNERKAGGLRQRLAVSEPSEGEGHGRNRDPGGGGARHPRIPRQHARPSPDSRPEVTNRSRISSGVAYRAARKVRKLSASSRFARRLPNESVTSGTWQNSGAGNSSAR